MILLFRNDGAAGGVGVPAAMVTHEASAQHIVAPIDTLAVDLVGQRGVKAVVCRAQREDGLSGINILHDQLPLGNGERQQPRKEDNKIGRGKLLQAGNVVRL